MKGGFVDTNVLVYAATGFNDEPEKWERAHELLGVEGHSASAQVLAEFYTICTVKHGLALEQANSWLQWLDRFTIQSLDRAVVLAGVVLSQQYRISYWDAALIAAAERLGVDVLYSEDLSHGQAYEGVTVINPFLES